MRIRVILLSMIAVAVTATLGLADDEVFVRSKDKPYKGVIKSESPRGVVMSGVKGMIPAENIIDVFYDIASADTRLNVYRPALASEKDYNDPDPKKKDKRKANLADALKKYGEAYAKVQEKAAKRHLEYKLAVLTARQALDDGADLEPAIKRLRNFKIRHPGSWQFSACLELLGRLQLDAKEFQDAEATYLELAQADVAEDTKREAELSAAQVGIKAGKHQAALAKLRALAAKLPKDSKYRGRAKIAEAECLLAAKKDPEATALLRQIIKDTSDKNLKALAYNALGVHSYQGENLKEARWDFLWVDVVYNQDPAEHAKALYYLWMIFDKLGDKERAQECREALVGDRSFAGLEWQRLALRETPKAAN